MTINEIESLRGKVSQYNWDNYYQHILNVLLKEKEKEDAARKERENFGRNKVKRKR